MTQKDRILKYMKDFGSISALEAMKDLGIMRLASRISEMIAEGVQIEKKYEKGENRYNEPIYYVRYSLGGNEENVKSL